MSSQDVLGDRYGTPAPWRRRSIVAVSAVLALAFLGWLGWTAWSHATPDVESDLVGYRVVDEHTATGQVSVRLANDGVQASCVLRAYAEDHTVVGELAFTPEFGASQPIEKTVRTERLATSVSLVGCTTPGESRPR